MKLQVLNGSFGKVLAAAATIAFMVSLTSPAQAQQGQWGTDRCYYAAAQNGQMVRQGCMLQLNGNEFYYDIGTSVMTNLRTRSSFRLAQQNGRLYVNAGAGWADAGPAAGLQAPNGTGLADGTRMAGNNWPGSGYAVVGGTSPSVTGHSQPDRLSQGTVDNHTWDAPNNTIYIQAR